MFSAGVCDDQLLTFWNFRTLKKIAPKHQLLVDLEEKSAAFDAAASKYSAKVAA